MITVSSIKCHLLSIPYGDGNVFGQPLGVKSVALVQVISKEGSSGWGEVYAGIYMPELVSQCVDTLGKRLKGRSFSYNSISELVLALLVPFVSDSGLVRSCIGGIELALYDLYGKSVGESLSLILNPEASPSIAVYASGGSVVMSPEEVALDAESAVHEGFGGFKMRVGLQGIERDVERVKEAKAALNGLPLMVDCIQGTLRNLDFREVEEYCERMSELEIFWLEEPLPTQNFLEYERLAAKRVLKSPAIAVGEAYTSYAEFAYVIEKKIANIIQPDLTHSGGIGVIKEVIDLVKRDELSIAMHCWGSPISIMANLHFALAFPSAIHWMEIPRVRLAFLQDLMKDLFTIIDGRICLESHLLGGLGLDISPEQLSDFEFVRESGYQIPNFNRA